MGPGTAPLGSKPSGVSIPRGRLSIPRGRLSIHLGPAEHPPGLAEPWGLCKPKGAPAPAVCGGSSWITCRSSCPGTGCGLCWGCTAGSCFVPPRPCPSPAEAEGCWDTNTFCCFHVYLFTGLFSTSLCCAGVSAVVQGDGGPWEGAVVPAATRVPAGAALRGGVGIGSCALSSAFVTAQAKPSIFKETAGAPLQSSPDTAAAHRQAQPCIRTCCCALLPFFSLAWI